MDRKAKGQGQGQGSGTERNWLGIEGVYATLIQVKTKSGQLDLDFNKGLRQLEFIFFPLPIHGKSIEVNSMCVCAL